MKKILITGASGFVGSHLVEAAVKMGFEVHAAVRKSSKIEDIRPFVHKFVFPSMNSLEELRTLFQEEQYAYVVHAAAMTKAKNQEEMFEVNVAYTEHLLEAAFSTNSCVERVVYVSSLAAVGPISLENEALINERTPYHPVTVYGRSKSASEQMILEKFKDKAISVFRPTAVYGPRERDLFILFDTFSKGVDPYIGTSPQILSFVYVKDLVDVLLQGCVYEQGTLQFYNISDGNLYSKYAMADIYKETFGQRPLRFHIPYSLVSIVAKAVQYLYKNSTKTPVIYPERLRELTAENWGCDISKAQEQLGFEPKFDLKRGLTETFAWYKSNKWL